MKNEKAAQLAANLAELMETAADWEKIPTTAEGVKIVKAPGRRGSPGSLMLEINPTGKRRGLFISTAADLEKIRQAINQDLDAAIQAIETVNGTAKKANGNGQQVAI